MQTETEREARQAMKWILNLLARIIVSYFSWFAEHVCVLFALFRIWRSRRDGFLSLFSTKVRTNRTQANRFNSIRVLTWIENSVENMNQWRERSEQMKKKKQTHTKQMYE